MTTRTIERYRALFREEDCASLVMERVTQALVEFLGTSIEQQRLDSTELRARYEQKNWEFSSSKGSSLTREEIAEDMIELLTRFEDIPRVSKRTTFNHLVRCFHEQCELVGDKVVLRKRAGSTVLNNPSDPDATYDGHKGVGYQVQVSETCDEGNETQLMLTAIPETACEQDSDAVDKVLDHLEEAGNKPKTLLADSAYGSDANHCECAERGVDLIAPVNKGGRNEDRLLIEHFELAPDNSVLCCPAGETPIIAHYDAEKGKGSASFDAETCSTCEHRHRCPAHRHKKVFRVRYTAKQLRLAQRRKDLATPKGRAQYAPRSGIEGTFSRAKSVTGLGRLRVRGTPAVSMAILLKLAGINILRALGSQKMQEHLAKTLSVSSPGSHPGCLALLISFLSVVFGRMIVNNARSWAREYEPGRRGPKRNQRADSVSSRFGLLLSG